MSRDNLGVSDLTELLHDATLQRGEWEPDRERLTLEFRCLRQGVDGGMLRDPVVLAVSGVSAIAVSYDPLSPEQRPSAFRAPDDAMLRQLSPWPLTAREVEAVADNDDACEDIELAAKTEWLKCDLRGARAAPHRLVLHDDAGTPRVCRWITIAFDQVTPLSNGQHLPWHVWADQYDAWWRGWKEYWARERAEAGAPSLEDTIISAASAGPTSAYRIAEPVVELEPNDVPAALLAAVVAWFEAQHASDDGTAQLAYARSITSWWIEERRANVVVTGVVHYPPDDESPAESVVTTYSFALRHRGGVWKVRMWTSIDADGPLPAWAARWTTGRVQLRT